MRSLKFEKDEVSDWYVVLPEWDGDKADLQMVCGADTFLDIVSQGEDSVYLVVSTEISEDTKYVLNKLQDTPEIGGAMYEISSFYNQNFEMWLCDVTRFVFNGEMPKTIYFS